MGTHQSSGKAPNNGRQNSRAENPRSDLYLDTGHYARKKETAEESSVEKNSASNLSGQSRDDQREELLKILGLSKEKLEELQVRDASARGLLLSVKGLIQSVQMAGTNSSPDCLYKLCKLLDVKISSSSSMSELLRAVKKKIDDLTSEDIGQLIKGDKEEEVVVTQTAAPVTSRAIGWNELFRLPEPSVDDNAEQGVVFPPPPSWWRKKAPDDVRFVGDPKPSYIRAELPRNEGRKDGNVGSGEATPSTRREEISKRANSPETTGFTLAQEDKALAELARKGDKQALDQLEKLAHDRDDRTSTNAMKIWEYAAKGADTKSPVVRGLKSLANYAPSSKVRSRAAQILSPLLNNGVTSEALCKAVTDFSQGLDETLYLNNIQSLCALGAAEEVVESLSLAWLKAPPNLRQHLARSFKSLSDKSEFLNTPIERLEEIANRALDEPLMPHLTQKKSPVLGSTRSSIAAEYSNWHNEGYYATDVLLQQASETVPRRAEEMLKVFREAQAESNTTRAIRAIQQISACKQLAKETLSALATISSNLKHDCELAEAVLEAVYSMGSAKTEDTDVILNALNQFLAANKPIKQGSGNNQTQMVGRNARPEIIVGLLSSIPADTLNVSSILRQISSDPEVHLLLEVMESHRMLLGMCSRLCVSLLEHSNLRVRDTAAKLLNKNELQFGANGLKASDLLVLIKTLALSGEERIYAYGEGETFDRYWFSPKKEMNVKPAVFISGGKDGSAVFDGIPTALPYVPMISAPPLSEYLVPSLKMRIQINLIQTLISWSSRHPELCSDTEICRLLAAEAAGNQATGLSCRTAVELIRANKDTEVIKSLVQALKVQAKNLTLKRHIQASRAKTLNVISEALCDRADEAFPVIVEELHSKGLDARERAQLWSCLAKMLPNLSSANQESAISMLSRLLSVENAEGGEQESVLEVVRVLNESKDFTAASALYSRLVLLLDLGKTLSRNTEVEDKTAIDHIYELALKILRREVPPASKQVQEIFEIFDLTANQHTLEVYNLAMIGLLKLSNISPSSMAKQLEPICRILSNSTFSDMPFLHAIVKNILSPEVKQQLEELLKSANLELRIGAMRVIAQQCRIGALNSKDWLRGYLERAVKADDLFERKEAILSLAYFSSCKDQAVIYLKRLLANDKDFVLCSEMAVCCYYSMINLLGEAGAEKEIEELITFATNPRESTPEIRYFAMKKLCELKLSSQKVFDTAFAALEQNVEDSHDFVSLGMEMLTQINKNLLHNPKNAQKVNKYLKSELSDFFSLELSSSDPLLKEKKVSDLKQLLNLCSRMGATGEKLLPELLRLRSQSHLLHSSARTINIAPFLIEDAINKIVKDIRENQTRTSRPISLNSEVIEELQNLLSSSEITDIGEGLIAAAILTEFGAEDKRNQALDFFVESLRKEPAVAAYALYNFSKISPGFIHSIMTQPSSQSGKKCGEVAREIIRILNSSDVDSHLKITAAYCLSKRQFIGVEASLAVDALIQLIDPNKIEDARLLEHGLKALTAYGHDAVNALPVIYCLLGEENLGDDIVCSCVEAIAAISPENDRESVRVLFSLFSRNDFKDAHLVHGMARKVLLGMGVVGEEIVASVFNELILRGCEDFVASVCSNWKKWAGESESEKAFWLKQRLQIAMQGHVAQEELLELSSYLEAESPLLRETAADGLASLICEKHPENEDFIITKIEALLDDLNEQVKIHAAGAILKLKDSKKAENILSPLVERGSELPSTTRVYAACHLCAKRPSGSASFSFLKYILTLNLDGRMEEHSDVEKVRLAEQAFRYLSQLKVKNASFLTAAVSILSSSEDVTQEVRIQALRYLNSIEDLKLSDLIPAMNQHSLGLLIDSPSLFESKEAACLARKLFEDRGEVLIQIKKQLPQVSGNIKKLEKYVVALRLLSRDEDIVESAQTLCVLFRSEYRCNKWILDILVKNLISMGTVGCNALYQTLLANELSDETSCYIIGCLYGWGNKAKNPDAVKLIQLMFMEDKLKPELLNLLRNGAK